MRTKVGDGVTITGEYSAESYRVFQDGQEIYQAGNAPGDSQGYVDTNRGVGLAWMRNFCRITTKELASEKSAKFGGIQRMDGDS